ncbi:DUF1614 domain-containing protein [Thiohalobacter sp. IOR34]|uniref:DUF1614 domain-containing protein n=1 Tax=Thiohalobacter sp. IOR34 TaxID=3057176 RepID=UPI0025AFEF5B|nr:DUF1614 domain-containing protein [Thiohalobacter sp. IOR34]WJW74974.1 DUF1614 domain-containing protein [Thiohalobacter sp. IOR34]
MFSPAYFIAFITLLIVLMALIQIGLLSIAFEKLGLSPNTGFLLLLASLFGSGINLPLARVRAEPSEPGQIPPYLRGLLRQPPQPFSGQTLIAINIGGCVIPVAFSLYLLSHHPLPLSQALLGILLVSAVSYAFSRPIPGLGIAMPALLAPITAALAALLINPAMSPPLAYVAGTLGVLIGADLLHMKDVRHLGTPVVSIGGAGTFDGIFITGIVAVLLA